MEIVMKEITRIIKSKLKISLNLKNIGILFKK
jgi:hypothetical protein